ncbi:uxt prefoldin-like subunit [Rhodnius prolixus]|uniref:Uncharacterized protein n=1 Tax=Rhodnius prolixus TaxID=13249 RepID=T1H9Y4_RHOPR
MSKANINIPDKIYKYETFLNDVLKEELKKIQIKLDSLFTDIAELLQLKQTIEVLQSSIEDEASLKSTIDIGCGFLMKAKINSTKTIYINVGCGYFVEYSLSEALRVIKKRSEHLEKQINIYKQQSASTKAHIKIVLLGLMELQKV